MNQYKADYVFPLAGPPIKDGVVTTEDTGRIVNIGRDVSMAEVQMFSGIITPGFINAHCHLELSHMRGKIPPGTGLIEFLKKVVTLRDTPLDTILQKIIEADKEMYEAGIVAVGDISNTNHSFSRKKNSAISYYTFLELFDFLQGGKFSKDSLHEALKIKKTLPPESCALSPHAPYTVSSELFQAIIKNNPAHSIISIHHQETSDEDVFLQKKEGGFLELYNYFNFPIHDVKDRYKHSPDYIIKHVQDRQKILLIHNTFTKKEHVQYLHASKADCYFVSCPNANLYIEGSLPDYQMFIDTEARLCLGTDSYSSNWQLSIFEEIKTISKHFYDIDIATLLNWACMNGAEALGLSHRLGTLETGKTPGLVLWQGAAYESGRIKNLEDVRIVRLI